MAMNKAEKAEMQALRDQFSLRWPMFEKPAPMTHDELRAEPIATLNPRDKSVWTERQVIVAWFMNAYSGRVTRGWVEVGLRHYNADDPSMTSVLSSRFEQHGGAYRTQADALRALRWAVSERAALELGIVDSMLGNAP